LLLITAVLVVGQAPAMAAGAASQQAVVDEAVVALAAILGDPQMEWFKNNLKHAKGVMIVPGLLKAGFIIGGSGGMGILLAHDKLNNQWSQPVFYSLGAGSIGLQIGAKKAMIILFIRTQNGLDRFYSSSFKLSADASIAAGPIGGGTGATVIADIYTFARTKGAFAGVSLEGTVISINDEYNKTYYGQALRPTDIIIQQAASNPGADILRSNLAAASK
jgi:lipid-binding SYLF domain-containing protein